LVRLPIRRNAVALAVVLTAQLLAGFVQTSYFTYELVALRIAWAVLVRERDRPLAVLLHAAIALVLPLALSAIVLLPATELVRESLRARPLTPHDIGPGFSWRLLL